MKNAILIILLLVSIFFLMPVGMLDFLTGGSVTPFKSFVVPAFWHAWNTQTGTPWLKKVPRPFSWLIQVFLTFLAVITFWGVMIYKPLVMLFRYFIREEVLDPEVQGIPASPEVVMSPFKIRRRAAATKIRKFALTTGRAAAAVPSRIRGVAATGFELAREQLRADQFHDATDVSQSEGELQEVTLQDRVEPLASNL